jgi:hypothetical protein
MRANDRRRTAVAASALAALMITLLPLLLYGADDSIQPDTAASAAPRGRPVQTEKAPYLIWPGNPAEMQVLWQLDGPDTCEIEWGLDTTYALGSAETTEYGTDHQHTFTIPGLVPGTYYYYRVIAPDAQHVGTFTAAPDPSATAVKFLAYGDTRTYPADHDQVASAMISTFTDDPAYQSIVAVVGDLVSDGDLEGDWRDEFFDPAYSGIQEFLRSVPYHSAMGNHEESGVLFMKYFPYPYVSGRYWSYDYGPAHFVVVDQYTSYAPGSAQLLWIESDLAASTKLWKFIQLHEPGWSAGGHSNEIPVQNYIQPLCEQYGVSIIFGGHNHYYARAEVNGVQHVTTGGGGAPLYSPIPSYPYVVTTAEVHHYCKISIDGYGLDFEAVTPEGDIIDSFSLEFPTLDFVSTDQYADEIDYLGEAVYHTVLENIGVATSTVTVDVAQEVLPEGVDPSEWTARFRGPDMIWHTEPAEYILGVGEQAEFEIECADVIGTVQGMALTTLTASGQDARTITSNSFATFVDLPSILLVDDDDGGTYETHMATAVVENGYAVRIWDGDALGRPSQGQLASYWAVLWTTADGDALYVTDEDEENLMDYLDGGGNLFLASMDYLSSRASANTFTTDYLHVNSWSNNNGAFSVTGVSGDPIGDGMVLPLLGGPFPSGNTDSMESAAPADTVFYAANGGKAVKVDESGHRLVFQCFPFELVKTDQPDPNNQMTLMGRVLDWFGEETGIPDGDDPLGRLALKQNFPNPFNPKTTIEFAVPAGTEHVRLSIYSVNGRLVRTLIDEAVGAGQHVVVWDGADENGADLGSGIYFARLATGGENVFRKMTLLK